jgi:DNA (cytosine-5)-methyltransferase 1
LKEYTVLKATLEGGAVTNEIITPSDLPAVAVTTAAGLTFVDLFCGIGGFHQALTQLGATCVLACDIDAKCREVYEANYGIKPHEDVTKLDTATMPDFDVLCGGFPCFVAGTQVLTESGYKAIETVSLEDRLLTHTGAFQRILNLQRKVYPGTLYNVDLKYHPRALTATDEHPFYVREKQADGTFAPPVWKPIRDITDRDFFGMAVTPKRLETTRLPVGLSELVRRVLEENRVPEWVQCASGGFLDAFLAVLSPAEETFSLSVALALQRIYFKLRRFTLIQAVGRKRYRLVEDPEDTEAFIDGEYAWRPSVRITHSPVAEPTPVYNFEVEHDNSYCVENTLVHNCQAFSHSGKQGGFEDTRGTLFRDCARILKDKQPKYFLMENVKNLKGHDGGRTWATIYKSLTEAGYVTYPDPVVLSPHQLGVPQHRERVLLMGLRKDLAPPSLPVLERLSPMPTLLSSILLEETPDGTALTADDTALLTLWEEMIQHMKGLGIKMPTFPLWSEEWDSETEWEGLPDWKAKFVRQNREFYTEHEEFLEEWLTRARLRPKFVGAKSKLEWQAGAFQDDDSLWTLLFQFRPSGIRVKRATYSPALVAMAQIVYVGEKRRKLSPREVARLQSFPDTFQLPASAATAYKQFGNSVNVEVIKYAMNHILTRMRSAPSSL